MNLQTYAAHRKAQGLRGASHVAVLKAIDTGRLTEPAVRKVNGRWQIDAPLADAQWAGNTNNMPDSGELPESTSTRQPHPADGGPSLAQAKRAKAVYEAELTRLALQREKKELVLADEVRREASRLARQVRDLLLMIPGRNAAKVATMQDQEAIRELLENEINSALRGLANETA
jgi:hypothetical protein